MGNGQKWIGAKSSRLNSNDTLSEVSLNSVGFWFVQVFLQREIQFLDFGSNCLRSNYRGMTAVLLDGFFAFLQNHFETAENVSVTSDEDKVKVHLCQLWVIHCTNIAGRFTFHKQAPVQVIFLFGLTGTSGR